ncbi:MAG: repair protein RecN [Actinomycetota bacterium]
MIDELSIEGLGLIDSVSLNLQPGLVVVSGETGAGKTLLLDAVRVLAGQKAGAVGVNAEIGASVEATLIVKHQSVSDRLDELGCLTDDEAVTISRQFPLTGRAKTLLGGKSVPSGVLAEIAQDWLAIHGQHDSYRLLKSSTHRELLDRFGGVDHEELVRQHRSNFKSWKKLVEELETLTAQREQLLLSADAIRADVALCESLNLQPGEDREIAKTIDRMSRVEQVRSAVASAVYSLSNDEVDVVSALSSSAKVLEHALPQDETVLEIVAKLDALKLEVSSVLGDIEAIGEGLDIDPDELDALMLRQRQLRSLLLRHGPEITDVLEWVQSSKRNLELIDPDGSALKALQIQVDDASSVMKASAQQLSVARAKVGSALSSAVESEVQGLALPHAIFQVSLEQSDISEFGQDKIEFMFTANPGIRLQPIAQAASGGELSRLMLALEVTMSDYSSPSVMVFDEVDAGVAGAAAISVAERLAKLSRDRQVLVVTHLPQIAAFADQHLNVSKSSDGINTQTHVIELQSSQRVNEIARMLAGLEDSDTALAHATELLSLAASTKENIR